MNEHNFHLGVFSIFILALFFLPSVDASTLTDNCELAYTCPSGFTEIASASGISNAHLSTDPGSSFPAKLCCNASMTYSTFGQEDMFSISNSGSNQGHVGENGTFLDTVAGSWTQCSLQSTCDTDQACVIEVTGGNQGHASSCGSGVGDSLCCCPYGTQWDGFTCLPRYALVDIVTLTADPSPAGVGASVIVRSNFTWGYDEFLNYEFWYTEQGETTILNSSGVQQFTTLAGSGVPGTWTTSFGSPGTYTIHAFAEKADGSASDSRNITINVPSGLSCVPDAEIAYSAVRSDCAPSLTPLGTDLNWTDSGVDQATYSCTGGQTCYIGFCKTGSYYNATLLTCVETVCDDGLDNDGDGDIDAADGDCITTSEAPAVTLIATPDKGPAPLEVEFNMTALDSGTSIQYNLTYGTGDVYARSGGWNIDDSVDYIYTLPGIYTATFSAKDNTDNSNSTSLQINVTNSAPTIILSASPQSDLIPYNSTLTVNITDDSPNVTVTIDVDGTPYTLFFDDYTTTQQIPNILINEERNYTVFATANDTYGKINTSSIQIEGVQPIGDVSGYVRFNHTDGSLSRARDAEVTISGTTLTSLSYSNVTRTTPGGEFNFYDVPAGNYDLIAIYNSYTSSSTPLTEQLDDGENLNNQNITINEDQTEYPDCTSNGRCDLAGIGQDGCFLPSDPNAATYTRVLEACDPPGRLGRFPGDRVTVDDNGTHREVALCCYGNTTWEPLTQTNIDADVNNLIRYTRTAIYQGQPVRVVIATWN